MAASSMVALKRSLLTRILLTKDRLSYSFRQAQQRRTIYARQVYLSLIWIKKSKLVAGRKKGDGFIFWSTMAQNFRLNKSVPFSYARADWAVSP